MILLALIWTLGGSTEERAADKAAQAVARIQGQIRSIDIRLNHLTDKLDELGGSSLKLSDEIEQLELKRTLIVTKIERHALELQEAGEKIKRNEAQRAELDMEADAQRERIGHRLRQLYKRGKLGHSQILLKQSRRAELINAYHYAKVMTRRDNDALAAFQHTIREIDRVTHELEDFRANAEQARRDMAQQRTELQSVLDQRTRRLAQIRAESGENQRLLNELELEKDEMLVFVRRIVDADADPMDVRLPITRYKGKLEWPAKGRVIQNFGIFRDPVFQTKQRRNGVDLAVPLGTPVKTVYSGRVIFADWFKSYGNVVIVDHGEKIISFYAHLDKLDVARGDFVDKGKVIGSSGDSGSLDGPMLHFEIREETEPVDPLTWLRR